jgi:hypothetical protein
MLTHRSIFGLALFLGSAFFSNTAFAQDTIAIDFLLCDDGVSEWPDCPDSSVTPTDDVHGKPGKKDRSGKPHPHAEGGHPAPHFAELQQAYDDRDEAYDKVYELVEALYAVHGELADAKAALLKEVIACETQDVKNGEYQPAEETSASDVQDEAYEKAK